MGIKVRRLSEAEIGKMGIKNWPIWEKEESKFDWSYGTNEDCLILEGEAEVTAEDGTTIKFGKGDFVSFPKGLKCVWSIKKAIRKHYNFG